MMTEKYTYVANSCDTHFQRLDDGSGFWILDFAHCFFDPISS
jgi:hypothetical protein